MSSRTPLLSTAALIGVITGVRSMAAVATLSRSLYGRSASPGGRAGRLLAGPIAAGALSLAQVGEMVGDKLPFVPARTELFPLLGRAAFTAFGCAALADDRRQSPLAPMAVGVAASVASTFAVTNARRLVTSRLRVPGFLFGLAEDVAVLTAAETLSEALADA
jgi:uncharacterized membrane protein